ncbi:hypothetical protein ACFW04_007306 [Cataglyphis niger]
MAEMTYSHINSGDEIVISGIAGRFPDSNNMNQLRENLFNKVNLVTANHHRFKKNTEYPNLPECIGTVNDLEKFDADFFNTSIKQAHTLDPMARLLLEHAYEAIIDAGINPMQLRGKNTGVIVGMTVLESQQKFMYENLQTDDSNIIGCSKSTMANILSYCLDLKGPSYTVDTACSSSLYAMALGYQDIMSGRCEDAIIGTAHLCLHPIINLLFSRFGIKLIEILRNVN